MKAVKKEKNQTVTYSAPTITLVTKKTKYKIYGHIFDIQNIIVQI